MRRREFPASYPLLGLLAYGPQSGYDLHKTAQATLAPFWHEGYAQVYSSLEVFEAQGLAEVVSAATEPRRRRIFALTEAGRRAFQAWLERPVETWDHRRHEVLVKVFFGSWLAPEVLAAHLEAYAQAQARTRHHLEALARRVEAENPGAADLPFWLATIDHGVVLGRAIEAWCQRTTNRTRG